MKWADLVKIREESLYIAVYKEGYYERSDQ